MLKRIFAAISALLTILFAALGVQWIDRSRKNHWDLPRLGIGLIWLSSTVWQFLSTCSLWQRRPARTSSMTSMILRSLPTESCRTGNLALYCAA